MEKPTILSVTFPNVLILAMVIDINGEPPREGTSIHIKNVSLCDRLEEVEQQRRRPRALRRYQRTAWMLSHGAFAAEPDRTVRGAVVQ
ncbi:hypothetical protein V6N13_139417 [Hibiscus sabdariffa]